MDISKYDRGQGQGQYISELYINALGADKEQELHDIKTRNYLMVARYRRLPSEILCLL